MWDTINCQNLCKTLIWIQTGQYFKFYYYHFIPVIIQFWYLIFLCQCKSFISHSHEWDNFQMSHGFMNHFTYDLHKFPYTSLTFSSRNVWPVVVTPFPFPWCVCVLQREKGCNHHTPHANTAILFSEGFPVWISSYSISPLISGKVVMSWGFWCHIINSDISVMWEVVG